MRVEYTKKAGYISLVRETTDGKKSYYNYLKDFLPASNNKIEIEIARITQIIRIAYLRYKNDCHSRSMIGTDASYIDFLLNIFPFIEPKQEDLAIVKQVKQTLDEYHQVINDSENIKKLKNRSEQLPNPDTKTSWESYFLVCDQYLKAHLNILRLTTRSESVIVTGSGITFFDDVVEKPVRSTEANELTRLLPNSSSLQFSEDEQEENTGCFSALRRLCCG